MKLIAKTDFRNNVEPRIKVDGAKHEDHVHQGAIFNYGRGETIEDCSPSEKQTIGLLAAAGCIGDANDDKLVQRIRKEVAAREKSEKNIAAANVKASGAAAAK